MKTVLLLLVSWALSYAGVYLCLRVAPRWGLIDTPNERSSHIIPTPRGGGLAIVFVSLAVQVLLFYGGYLHITLRAFTALVVGGALVAGIGYADDIRSQSIKLRLACQVMAGVMVASAGYGLHRLWLPGAGWVGLGILAYPLGVLVVVYLTNIHNFMDGIDGLAGGVAFLGLSAWAAAAWRLGADDLALLAACSALASAGFLFHNFPPARIFMGDVGSGYLGFVFAALGLLGVIRGIPAMCTVLALGPFLFDSTVTLIRRMIQGEAWYQAHRTHYYQRLTDVGWTHRDVTLAYYGLTLVTGGGAVIYALGGGALRMMVLAGVLVLLTACAFGVNHLEHIHRAQARRTADSGR